MDFGLRLTVNRHGATESRHRRTHGHYRHRGSERTESSGDLIMIINVWNWIQIIIVVDFLSWPSVIHDVLWQTTKFLEYSDEDLMYYYWIPYCNQYWIVFVAPVTRCLWHPDTSENCISVPKYCLWTGYPSQDWCNMFSAVSCPLPLTASRSCYR